MNVEDILEKTYESIGEIRSLAAKQRNDAATLKEKALISDFMYHLIVAQTNISVASRIFIDIDTNKKVSGQPEQK